MPRRSMLEMPPIFPVKFPDGTWSNSGMVSDPFGFEAIPNPVHVSETEDRLRQRTQLFGNVYINSPHFARIRFKDAVRFR